VWSAWDHFMSFKSMFDVHRKSKWEENLSWLYPQKTCFCFSRTEYHFCTYADCIQGSVGDGVRRHVIRAVFLVEHICVIYF
jgi:hypothetical protein